MQSFGKCVKEGLLTRALASAPHMSLSGFSVSVSQIFYNWPGDFTGLSSAPWKWSTPHDVLAFRTTLTSITYHKWFQYDFIGQSKCVGILAHLSLSHLSLVLFFNHSVTDFAIFWCALYTPFCHTCDHWQFHHLVFGI